MQSVTLVTFSDAAYGVTREASGQYGIIARLKLESIMNTLYLPSPCTSSVQKKICYSSVQSKILAGTDVGDRVFQSKGVLTERFPQTSLKHNLLMYSKSLLETNLLLIDPVTDDYYVCLPVCKIFSKQKN